MGKFEIKMTEIATLNFAGKSLKVNTFGTTDMLSNIIVNGLIWEPKVANWIAQNVNDKTTFIDIGCNIGVHTLIAYMSNCNQIYSFECDRNVYDKLISTLRLNSIEHLINIFNVGVSNAKTDLPFIKVQSNISASYIETTHNNFYNDIEKVDNVNVDTLNSLIDLSTIPLNNSIIIKIDIEGHELEALEGMDNILNDIRTTQVIVELTSLITSLERVKLVIDTILSYRFNTIKLLFDVRSDPWGGSELKDFKFKTISKDELLNILTNNNKPLIEVVFIRE